eukprot:Em0829g4a
MSTITLPYLRIIRGQDTFSSSGGPVSLLVNGFTNGFLNLPSLTEISNGRAVFVSTSGTCGFLNVLWTDIFLSNGDLDYSILLLLPFWSLLELWFPLLPELNQDRVSPGCGRCFKSPEMAPISAVVLRVPLVAMVPQAVNVINDLEVLSTIQEIQGFLRIESLSTLTSFPYLRNLKKIGYPGTAVNLSITGSRCQPGGPQWYSLVLRITSQLQSIDFSSLEVIQYGGYLLGVAAGFVCHSQCASNSSCWGPNDTQCDGCRNFVYKGRCPAIFQLVPRDLPIHGFKHQTPLLWDRPSLLSIVQDVSTWCLPCDDVCASCTGPGNTSCTTCRYAQRLAQCVSGCNNDTEYQNGDLYCHPCAAGCVGCTGPSISQCLKCASGSCASANLLQSSDIIGIVFGSIAAIFLATGAVLMLFIVYRRYEHKVFKIRAQSTAMYCNKGREGVHGVLGHHVLKH